MTNIPPNLPDEKLRELFESRFGAVDKAYRIRSVRGKKRPFGFVLFRDIKDANFCDQTGFVEFEGARICCRHFKKEKPGRDQRRKDRIQRGEESPGRVQYTRKNKRKGSRMSQDTGRCSHKLRTKNNQNNQKRAKESFESRNRVPERDSYGPKYDRRNQNGRADSEGSPEYYKKKEVSRGFDQRDQHQEEPFQDRRRNQVYYERKSDAMNSPAEREEEYYQLKLPSTHENSKNGKQAPKRSENRDSSSFKPGQRVPRLDSSEANSTPPGLIGANISSNQNEDESRDNHLAENNSLETPPATPPKSEQNPQRKQSGADNSSRSKRSKLRIQADCFNMSSNDSSSIDLKQICGPRRPGPKNQDQNDQNNTNNMRKISMNSASKNSPPFFPGAQNNYLGDIRPQWEANQFNPAAAPQGGPDLFSARNLNIFNQRNNGQIAGESSSNSPQNSSGLLNHPPSQTNHRRGMGHGISAALDIRHLREYSDFLTANNDHVVINRGMMFHPANPRPPLYENHERGSATHKSGGLAYSPAFDNLSMNAKSTIRGKKKNFSGYLNDFQAAHGSSEISKRPQFGVNRWLNTDKFVFNSSMELDQSDGWSNRSVGSGDSLESGRLQGAVKWASKDAEEVDRIRRKLSGGFLNRLQFNTSDQGSQKRLSNKQNSMTQTGVREKERRRSDILLEPGLQRQYSFNRKNSNHLDTGAQIEEKRSIRSALLPKRPRNHFNQERGPPTSSLSRLPQRPASLQTITWNRLTTC